MSNFTVVSFYTDEVYEALSKRLIASLEKFSIPYDIQKRDNLHNWNLNTRQKAPFMKEMLHKYERVVFIDCDGEVNQYPSLFDTIDCDVAAAFRGDTEFLSGTLFMRRGENVFALVDRWIIRNEMSKSPVEQKNLWNEIFHDKSLNFYKLPPTYTQIFDLMADVGNPVISHYQESRKTRRRYGG